MKRYEEYKTASQFWLDLIPLTWKMAKINNIFREVSRKGYPNEEPLVASQHHGVIPKSMYNKRTVVVQKNFDQLKLVEKGDFVISLRSFQGGIEIAHYRGIISAAYTILENTDDNISNEFLRYLLKSRPFIELLKTTVTGIREGQNIDYFELKQNFIPIPPRQEQDQIVRYLDWKTSEINHFINQKKKQIKNLEELKWTKIDHLITKGLSTCSMKDSGVEWIGEIPEHWNIDTIKQHFRIKKRIAGEEGYEVLSITQQGIKVKNISTNEGQMAQSYANYQFVYPGEFAMNHMDLITGFVDISKYCGVTSPDYRVFSLEDREHCNPEFYLKVFQIAYKRRIFYKFGKGAASQGRWRLPKDAFLGFSIQVPPLKEQAEIVKECNQVEDTIDKLIAGVESEISLIEELKTKLISDAVTGQIDVRDVVIPEYITEDEISDDNMNEADEVISDEA